MPDSDKTKPPIISVPSSDTALPLPDASKPAIVLPPVKKTGIILPSLPKKQGGHNQGNGPKTGGNAGKGSKSGFSGAPIRRSAPRSR